MLRNVNGRALRRLLARPAASAPSASSRGVATMSMIAPVAAQGRRAALAAARGRYGLGRALMPSTLLPPCAAGLSSRSASTFLDEYNAHVEERAAEGIAPKPLDAKQVSELVAQLESPPAGEEAVLLDLFENRVPPGVDEAAYVKAGWLAAVVEGKTKSPLVSPLKAVQILDLFMQGGYNIQPLIAALDTPELAEAAADCLSKTLLMFDAFHDVEAKAKAGNAQAKRVMQSWADAEWFTTRPKVPEKITFTVFKVTGETNTDDLSPAPDAWSRPDIPLHALAMLKNPREGSTRPEADRGAGEAEGASSLAYVGDVVGTGSSRKSATNSVLWFMGDDIPNVPNKRTFGMVGGLCIGSKIAPSIFFNTMEDSGALPIEMPVDDMAMGDVVDIYPYEGVASHETGEEIIAGSR